MQTNTILTTKSSPKTFAMGENYIPAFGIQSCTSKFKLTCLAIFASILWTNAQTPGSGYTLNFDNTDDEIIVPNNASMAPTTSNTVTVEAWVKPSASGYIASMYTNGTSSTSNFYISINGSFKVSVTGNGTDVLTSNAALPSNEWSHVAVVLGSGSGNTKIYIDGTLNKSGTLTYNSSNGGATFNIGALKSNMWGNDYFSGAMDEMKVWDTEVSLTTIRDWMCKKVTSSHTNYSDLIAYYKFDENTGTTLTDSKNSNNGSFSSSPSYATSGAPIGDEAVWVANATTSSSLNLAHSNGDDVTMSLTTGIANLMALYRVDEAPNVTTPPGDMEEISSTNYFGAKLFGAVIGSYSIVYNYAGHSFEADEDEIEFASRDDNATTSWTEESGATLNTTSNTVTLTGQTGTEFILGKGAPIALPVELLSFNANVDNGRVTIQWSTASETNNDFYTVEKSTDLNEWIEVSSVSGAGTSSQSFNYTKVDANPYQGISYYRLKQTDFDGQTSYSSIRKITFETNSKKLVGYPNPAYSNVMVSGDELDPNQLRVFNSIGVQLPIRVQNLRKKSVSIDLSDFPKGMYFISNGNQTLSIVKK